MKRNALIALALLLASGTAFADGGSGNKGCIASGTAASENKKYHNGNSPDGTVQSQKVKGFWQREAERSGFAGTGAMISNGISGAIPLAKPNSGKKQS
jgi:hypothetical protein